MNLSFTLDEKIFTDISAEGLIDKAVVNHVKGLEISPDTDILSLNKYKSVVKYAAKNSLNVNYHIPYFANSLYEIVNFGEFKDKLIDKYIQFLSLLETLQEYLINPPIIVVHGSDYSDDNKEQGVENTLKLLEFLLNEITRRNLPFTIALETLRKKTLRNTFDTREDIFYFLNNFDSDYLKICWDMCHDKLNFYPSLTPLDVSFLNQVVYGHIHGHNISTDTSHLSFLKSDLDYSLELKSLKNNGFLGNINIELLSNSAKSSYLTDLFNDIDYINRHI